MGASFSSRWSRQGECTSITGIANRNRQGSRPSQRLGLLSQGIDRRPTTWSQRSIASSKGSRCAPVQGSSDEVTRTKGNAAPSRPSSRARDAPRPAIGTTLLSAVRPRSVMSRTRASAASSARVKSPWARTMTRIAAPGKGSRWKWASKGSMNSSDVDIRPPADSFGSRRMIQGRAEKGVQDREGWLGRSRVPTVADVGDASRTFRAIVVKRAAARASARPPRDTPPEAGGSPAPAGRRPRVGRRSG
jgi:hypothetical protein